MFRGKEGRRERGPRGKAKRREGQGEEGPRGQAERKKR
jgi:hypothetical protein